MTWVHWDTIDFTVGAEGTRPTEEYLPSGILYRIVNKWQENREMRIQSLCHDSFVYVIVHLGLICREMRIQPLGPQTGIKKNHSCYILNKDRSTWSESRMVKKIGIDRHIKPKDCLGIAENCEKLF